MMHRQVKILYGLRSEGDDVLIRGAYVSKRGRPSIVSAEYRVRPQDRVAGLLPALRAHRRDIRAWIVDTLYWRIA